MSFTCPIHGYYTPTPGTTVAICPSCQAAPAQPPVEQEGTARIAERFQKATDHAVHQSLPTVNIGWKLATEIARVLDPAPEQGEARIEELRDEVEALRLAWEDEGAEWADRLSDAESDLYRAEERGAP